VGIIGVERDVERDFLVFHERLLLAAQFLHRFFEKPAVQFEAHRGDKAVLVHARMFPAPRISRSRMAI